MGPSGPSTSSDHQPTPDLRGLVAACSPALLLYARTWVTYAEAEDLLQEALVKLLLADRGPVHLRPVDARAWLFRVVRNLAINRLRIRKRRRTHGLDACQEPALFAAAADALADPADVHAALRALSEPDREVLILRIWAGLTLEQIAELTSTSTATVFRTHQRALAAMRQHLERNSRSAALPAALPSSSASASRSSS